MQLQHKNYDIIIIGAGAVGSGILLDASLRGYKVLLLEKDDYPMKKLFLPQLTHQVLLLFPFSF